MAKEAIFDLYRGHGPTRLQQTPTKFGVLKIALDLAVEDGFELFQSFLFIFLKDLSLKICIKAQPPGCSGLICTM